MFRRRDEVDFDYEANSESPTTTFGGFNANKPSDSSSKQNDSAFPAGPYNPAATSLAAAEAKLRQPQMPAKKSVEDSTATKKGSLADKLAGSPLKAQSSSSSSKPSSLADVTPSKSSPSTYSISSSGVSSSKSSKSSNEAGNKMDQVEAERRLTVGYGITLEGKISDCDKLIIYGKVNAELNSVKALHISESGRFSGVANIANAEISGAFDGELFVSDTITINSTGKVSGKITYGSIEIKPGGKFTGQIVEAVTLGSDNGSVNSKRNQAANEAADRALDSNGEFTLSPEPISEKSNAKEEETVAA
ncbi:MAG: hypothetical protein COV36_05920 [Alphaproteobacteria bacterium CG11_big_fil_rev_8_21_14_0_20_44_7]|nr:MAG: hypothetical protein COV36_05920 [Alphaproteobacteria bacterium CG11_big_fil_rev_8_21_14_0_20_44_7]